MFRYLTQSEVEMLPEGAEISVIWADSVDAKNYLLRFKGGYPVVVNEQTPWIVAGVLGLIGSTRKHDRVFLREHHDDICDEQVAYAC